MENEYPVAVTKWVEFKSFHLCMQSIGHSREGTGCTRSKSRGSHVCTCQNKSCKRSVFNSHRFLWLIDCHLHKVNLGQYNPACNSGSCSSVLLERSVSKFHCSLFSLRTLFDWN